MSGGSCGDSTGVTNVCLLEPEPMAATVPSGDRYIGVPDGLMVWPGARVWPAMTSSEASLAVYVERPLVRTGACAGLVVGAGARAALCPLLKIAVADGANRYTTPSDVTAAPPGTRTPILGIEYCDDSPGLILDPAQLIIGVGPESPGGDGSGICWDFSI